jgi:hypothetical protein
MNTEIQKLFARRRWCYFIPLDSFVEGMGYRPSIVFEGEPGHYPHGDWPYEGKPGQHNPWFWGPTREDAVNAANEQNERLGISKRLAVEIIASSMAVDETPRAARRRA